MPQLLRKRIELHLTVESQRQMLEAQSAIIKKVADLVESRDDITGGHVERTQHGLEVLVEGSRIDRPMHDAGSRHEERVGKHWDRIGLSRRISA
jgi:response regulator RpfG family c-di-GMP phosphodiesterase